MNVYRVLGDRVGTLEARELAQQLVAWHDAMVRHLRVVNQDGGRCREGCPHAEARALWPAVRHAFGDDARELRFLQAHSGARTHRADAAGPHA